MIIITGTGQELAALTDGMETLLNIYANKGLEKTIEACKYDHINNPRIGLDFVMAHGYYMEITQEQYDTLNRYDIL